MVEVKMLAKKFKYVNTKLLIVSQHSPIDNLLQRVFITVDSNLETIKHEMISPKIIEKNLLAAEKGMISVEKRLRELKSLNEGLVAALNIK